MKKRKALAIQTLSCLIAISVCWFSYLQKQNELTSLKIYAPKLHQEIRKLQEENAHLEYELQELQSPQKLLELAQDSRFSHLKHPFSKNILVLEEHPISSAPQTTFAAGAP